MHETVKQTVKCNIKEAIHDKNSSIEKLKSRTTRKEVKL